jgi:hypothetical protein
MSDREELGLLSAGLATLVLAMLVVTALLAVMVSGALWWLALIPLSFGGWTVYELQRTR